MIRKPLFMEIRGAVFQRRRQNVINRLRSQRIISDKRQIKSIKLLKGNKTSAGLPRFIAVIKRTRWRK